MDTLELLSMQSLPVSPLCSSLWDLVITRDWGPVYSIVSHSYNQFHNSTRTPLDCMIKFLLNLNCANFGTMKYDAERFFSLWMDVFSGFLTWLHFPFLPVFKDPILSTLCLFFVPEEEELYLLETLVVFSVILCSFSVLWNNVSVFQFNVSLPHCIGKFV